MLTLTTSIRVKFGEGIAESHYQQIADSSVPIMTGNTTVTERLAEWICSESYDRLPAAVRDQTVDVIFDTVGGMAACSILPEIKMIVKMIEQQGGRPECTIIGHRATTSVINAAMANGSLAHGDEVDAIHRLSAGGHIAALTVPTALAVGEWANASGKDIIRAVALGYEVGGRLITMLYRERDYIARRFNHGVSAGSLSSAVTAGVLLGLDRQALQVALGLATYQAGCPDNLIRDPTHMAKTFLIGTAHRNGVTAALLARQGCFVPLDILDGTLGFFDAFLNMPGPELGAELLKDLGSYYSISDVMPKRYPAGAPNQTYLQALFHLLQENPIAPEEIEQIEVHIPKRGVHRIPTSRHVSISGIAVCAIAAFTGKLDWYFLHGPAGPVNAAIEAMQQRIHFVGREDWTGMEQGRHAIVIIRTRAGRTFEKEVWHQPMTRAELECKFHDLVEPRFGLDKTAQLQKLLSEVETAASIRPLMKELRG